jgi:HAD superfamily hydrolase (TIGR01484 family)
LSELDLIDNNNYTICFNGSLIVDNLEKKMFESYIDENVAIKIDEFIKSNNIDWTYYLEDSRLLRRDIININEFVNKGMTKVKAIELVLNKLTIDKENVVAIGDGENDIDMIKFAKYGIAMSNSTEIVKENADIVTRYSNNEDGVYYAIKELLNTNKF